MLDMVYFPNPLLSVLDEGNHLGFHYVILSFGTHPCAYVELPEGHKYYAYKGNPWDMDINCHGGVSYCKFNLTPNLSFYREGFYIGWDYNHICDFSGFELREGYTPAVCYTKTWSTQEILEEVKEVISQLRERQDM